MSALTEAQHQRFLEHLPVVGAIARELVDANRGRIEYDDLFQDGCLGLLVAVERYDPERNSSFAAYARPRVRGAMLDGLRRRIPEWREAQRLRAACRRCEQFVPAGEDLLRCALRTECPRRALRGEVSIEALGALVPLAMVVRDQIPDHLLSMRLRAALRALSHRERLVLLRHYFSDQTLQEIAELLDVSAGRAAQIHAAALRKLRAMFDESGLKRAA